MWVKPTWSRRYKVLPSSADRSSAVEGSCKNCQFHDDVHSNTFGITKKEKYIAKSDFKMKLIAMVEALENTGYICDVTTISLFVFSLSTDIQVEWEGGGVFFKRKGKPDSPL